MVNRTQALVLGFFALVWIALLAILAVAPGIYEHMLGLSPENRLMGALGLVAAVTVLIVLLAVGVVRRWRWTFWLIVLAFLLGGVLRVPASALQLAGLLPADSPAWYTLFQGVLGVAQVGIGLAMVGGYRRAGVWGSF